MIAVQIADYFILKRDRHGVRFDLRNLVIWALGFALYRVLMGVDIPLAARCRICLRWSPHACWWRSSPGAARLHRKTDKSRRRNRGPVPPF